MELGAFSVSLAVKDLSASKLFYEKLGFAVVDGVADQNWLILRNGTTTIGLFQDMFEKNMLTFNPGWGHDAQDLERFTDVRDLQESLESADIEFASKVEAESEGPGSFLILDPDGNPVLFDQHR